MSELWCHTHYRLTSPVMTLTYDCWPGKRFPQWHSHVEYLWHIWLQFLHYVQRYCIMQNRWLRTARLMPLEHNASSTYYWRMNKNWAQSLVTDSLLVQMLRKNSGTAAWTAFNTVKFYHPFNQLLPVIITFTKEVTRYPAFAWLCVSNFTPTDQIFTEISPEIYPVDKEKLKLWTSPYIWIPIQEFFEGFFDMQDKVFFYNLPLISETRCSAIAERPRCRVRYSFRQK